MGHLFFEATQFLSELEALRQLAERFVDPSSPYKLTQLEKEFKGVAGCGSQKSFKVEILEARPWRTRISDGEFEPKGRKCGTQVYGEVSGAWEIRAEASGAKKNQKKLFQFTGLASTKIKVFDTTSDNPIAAWKIELGDPVSPGAYFHTHAGSNGTLPVPRHPNLCATPMAAIEYVLGELFQDSWDKAVQGTTDPPNRWRSIQKQRMMQMLNWARDKVNCTHSSPWMTLKAAKPESDLFVHPLE